MRRSHACAHTHLSGGIAKEMVLGVAIGSTLFALGLSTRAPTVRVALLPSRAAPASMNILEAATDGDISAVLELGALAVAGVAGSASAYSLVQRDSLADEGAVAPSPPPTGPRKMAVEVDLGLEGEPKGVSRLLFKPLLERSELVLLELRTPLGLLIEERADHGGSIACKGALPGYSSFGKVEEDDLLRAVTGYAMVAGDAPMWQQVTSGTPVGDVALKRCIFRTDGATTYGDVRSAISSHRPGDGGNGVVTLIIERALNSSTPDAPPAERPRLEPLQDVIARDLAAPRAPPSKDAQLPNSERAKRWLMRGTTLAAVAATRRTSIVRCCAEDELPPAAVAEDEDELAWRDAEDWALADGAPAFTVGRGPQTCTFWTALIAATPELAARSPAACESRWRVLAAAKGKAAKGKAAKGTAGTAVGPQPPVLSDWQRLADGRYAGRLSGETGFIWLTVALEGRLDSDPRTDVPGYIEAVGGRIYELGTPSPTATAPTLPQPTAAAALTAPAVPAGASGLANVGGGEMSSLRKDLTTAAAAAVLAGGVGFGVGVANAPPPPPPPPPPINRIFIAPSSGMRTAVPGTAQGGQEAMYPPVSGGRPKAPLTVEEQRQRQELRVERDKARLGMMQQRLKEDEQALTEFTRVQAERGADSAAVKLVAPVFPPDTGPRAP